MPGDAKLGLVVGVSLVVVVAVIFFRRDPATAHPPLEVAPAAVNSGIPPEPPLRSRPAKTTRMIKPVPEIPPPQTPPPPPASSGVSS